MAESDTALIGEVGKNVNNTIDPDIGEVVNGDIGIMNFSRIYSLIRSDMTYPNTVKAGQRPSAGSDSRLYNYVSYKNFINEENISLFSDYLRYMDQYKEDNEFITKIEKAVVSTVWDNYNLPSTIPDEYTPSIALTNDCVTENSIIVLVT